MPCRWGTNLSGPCREPFSRPSHLRLAAFSHFDFRRIPTVSNTSMRRARNFFPSITYAKTGGIPPLPSKNLQVLLQMSARRHASGNSFGSVSYANPRGTLIRLRARADILPRSLHSGQQKTLASGRDDRWRKGAQGERGRFARDDSGRRTAKSAGLRSPRLR